MTDPHVAVPHLGMQHLAPTQWMLGIAAVQLQTCPVASPVHRGKVELATVHNTFFRTGLTVPFSVR